jgi:hypothetical protein
MDLSYYLDKEPPRGGARGDKVLYQKFLTMNPPDCPPGYLNVAQWISDYIDKLFRNAKVNPTAPSIVIESL